MWVESRIRPDWSELVCFDGGWDIFFACCDAVFSSRLISVKKRNMPRNRIGAKMLIHH